jgi:glutaredoxin-related protein
MSRKTLSTEKLTPEASEAISNFHGNVVSEVANAVDFNRVVVVGMAMNPFVMKARRALDAAGIPFKYLEYGSYTSKWKERLAIKIWSGWPTYPQVFVDGKLVGGFQETKKALVAGKITK